MSPMLEAPQILGFADRRDGDGGFPVTDRAGAVVARIETAFLRSQFVAYDAAGNLLCRGRLRPLGPWEATDASGAPLASISRGAFDQHRLVLAHARLRGSLRGRAFSREWRVEDDAGTVVLAAVPHKAGWIFAPDAWLVQSSLPLAETVAVVELHRMDVKRARNDSG